MNVLRAALSFAFIFNVAAAFAAGCDAETRQLGAFAASVSVKVIASEPVIAGDPVTVAWSVAPSALTPTSKIYLMVTMPDAVRFGGTGFVTYPGGIDGPAGIDFDKAVMRVVTPLHIPGNPTSGQYEIKPYREGPFELRWSVVAATKCGGVRLTEPKAFAATVESSRGSIVVHDLYDFTVARSVIESIDGRYRLQSYDGFYQVFDKASGAKIVDRKGYCPDFSPTGRFVAALSSKGADKECDFNGAGMGAPKFEVVDLVTGALLAQPYPPVLWAYGDAYLVVPAKWWKDVQPYGHVLGLLVDGDEGLVGPLIEGSESQIFAFRLDDGLILTSAPQGYNAINGKLILEMEAGAQTDDAGIAEYERFVGLIPGGGNDRSIYEDKHVFLSHTRYLDSLDDLFYGLEARIAKAIAKRSPVHPASNKPAVATESSDDSGAVLAAGAARGAVSLVATAPVGDRVAALVSDLLSTGFRSSDTVETIGGDMTRRMNEVDAMKLSDEEKQALYFGRNEEIQNEIVARVSAEIAIARPIFDQPVGCFEGAARLNTTLAGAWRYEAGGRIVWLVHASCMRMGTVGDATDQLDLFVSDNGATAHYNLLFDDEMYGAAASGLADAEQEAEEVEDDGTADPADEVEVESEAEAPGLVDDSLLTAEDDDGIAGNDGNMAGTEGNPDGEAVDESDGEEAEIPPPPYDRLASAATGQPVRMDPGFRLILGSDDLNPGFVAGRFIVIAVADQLYVVDHQRLTLAGPIQLAATSQGARFLTTADNRNVLQINDDGSLAIHGLPDGRQKLRGRYVDDELVLFDEAGYFTSTRDGARFVNLRFAGRSQLYSLAQLSSVLARPDRIKAALDADASPPETVKLAAPPLLAARLTAKKSGGDIAVDSSASGGLKELRVFEDGVLAHTIPLQGRSWQGTIKFEADDTARWATVIVSDAAGFESQPASFRLQRKAKDGGRLFALAVGTDTYVGSAQLPDLKFAGVDARKFIETSKRLEGRSYSSVVAAAPIVDDADMLAKLDRQLGLIASQSTPRDTVMLFFAGHGLQSADGRYYLAAPATSLEDLDGTALAWSRLAAALARMKGRVFVFVDACHSGGVEDANDGAVDAILGEAGRSVAVIAASKGRQFSFETASQGGGYFTAALTDALRSGTKLDLDRSGLVELDELYLGLKRSVVQATGGQQTPWIARGAIVGKMPVF